RRHEAGERHPRREGSNQRRDPRHGLGEAGREPRTLRITEDMLHVDDNEVFSHAGSDSCPRMRVASATTITTNPTTNATSTPSPEPPHEPVLLPSPSGWMR